MSEVDLYLEKAKGGFRSAEILLNAGESDAAASRTYYGYFYTVKALLLNRGAEAASHGQVIAQYGLHFAKSRQLDPRFHRLLMRAFNLRQEADYAVDVPIEPEVIAELLAEGRRFLEAAHEYLRKDEEAEDGENDPESEQAP